MRVRTPASILAAALFVGVLTAGIGAAGSLNADPAPTAAEWVSPDPETEALVDHRQGVMRAVSGHMAATAAILLDGAPFEENLQMHGSTLSALLADIPALFPEGSEHEESDARAEIWSDADTFRSKADDTAEAAAALAAATEGGDPSAMIQAFSALGSSCGACHEDFRN